MPSHKILVVDDDGLILMGTEAMIEDMGHEVHTAPSGEQALELLERVNGIELVLTDQAMPNMTGLELRDAIMRKYPGLPVAICTGYNDLRESHSDDLRLLGKPISAPELEQTIRDLLD